MEFKAIIYIIAGVLYFINVLRKKAQEKKKEAQAAGGTPTMKPVSPPDVNRDKEKRRTELETQRNKPVQTTQPSRRPELKPVVTKQEPHKKSYYEVQAREEAARQLTVEEVPIAALIAQQEVESDVPYEFDARQAMIGSIIFERKY